MSRIVSGSFCCVFPGQSVWAVEIHTFPNLFFTFWNHLLSRGCPCVDQREGDAQCSTGGARLCHLPHLWGQRRPCISQAPPSLSLASQESVHQSVHHTSPNASSHDLNRLSLDVLAVLQGRINSIPTEEFILTDSKKNPPRKVKVITCTKRHNPTLWRAKPALGSPAGNPPVAWVNINKWIGNFKPLSYW